MSLLLDIDCVAVARYFKYKLDCHRPASKTFTLLMAGKLRASSSLSCTILQKFVYCCLIFLRNSTIQLVNRSVLFIFGNETNPMNQFRSIRILVAEDHEIVRDGICAIINQQEDMSVIAEAENGERAVQLYQKHQPDVVLMDLRMPILEGVEAIAKIKSQFELAKIIVLTTYDTDEDIYRGLQAGAKGYLLKDISADTLATAIRTVDRGNKYVPSKVAMKLAERITTTELTNREMEVLRLLTKGNSNQEIGSKLKITEGTVKFHVNNILSKLNVSDRTQAVITGLKRGLTRLD